MPNKTDASAGSNGIICRVIDFSFLPWRDQNVRRRREHSMNRLTSIFGLPSYFRALGKGKASAIWNAVVLWLRQLSRGVRLSNAWSFGFLAILALTVAADEPANSSVVPSFGVAGEQVLHDDFSSEKLDVGWRVVKGSWEVKDGLLRGLQIPVENHAAVLRRELALHDFIAEFQFKFDAGKAVKLVVNKDTVHIATVSFWPELLTIDKQPEKNSGKQIRRLDSQKVSLSANEWHTARVEVIGNTIVALVDHRLCVLGSDDGLDTGKTDFDFAANGSITLKGIKFMKATPPGNVETAHAKLRTFRDASK